MSEINWYILVFTSLIVPGVYLFEYHVPLIIKGKWRSYFTALCLGIAIIGLILLIVNGFDRHAKGTAVFLFAPLVHLYLFKGLYAGFVAWVGRGPIAVDNNWEPGLWKDRAFAFVVWLGFIFLVMGALALVWM
ncbi:MAG: hypothetical protein J5I65_02900 [Aridibacter famidurans]|nr:hypothetical protein [Aridibacter famidurans]